jgi:hypothetical protein
MEPKEGGRRAFDVWLRSRKKTFKTIEQDAKEGVTASIEEGASVQGGKQVEGPCVEKAVFLPLYVSLI